MDESLSEFQESKKRCAGPKTLSKSKARVKKGPKKIAGQKDIRKALKSKKNELQAFSKDFDNVCRKAGIDVDSEQLQLAIALSKSLQNTTSNEEAGTSQPLSSQNRINKIRTTLQEYGFKVPETKIAAPSCRRIRKLKKDYCLISTTDTERNQIIADKYSQVLFQNLIDVSSLAVHPDSSNNYLFYLATNIRYDTLKLNETFYVQNLIEISDNSGNLLRDWSEIPGRPVSPKMPESKSLNFSEIECSQDELDIILSGPLQRCKNIFSSKQTCVNSNLINCKGNCINLDIVEENIEHSDSFQVSMDKADVLQSTDGILPGNNNCKSNMNDQDNLKLQVPPSNHARSCSPDLFDDDVSSMLDNSKDKSYKTLIENENNETLQSATALDIICSLPQRKSCIAQNSIEPCLVNNKVKTQKPKLQFSQPCNIIKIKSNDLMEMTECIQSCSQPIYSNINIDLTQDSDDEDNITKCKNVAKYQEFSSIKHSLQAELTGKNEVEASSQSSLDKNITKRKSNDCMEMTECVNFNSQPINANFNIDLTQRSDDEEDTEKVQEQSEKNRVCRIGTPIECVSGNIKNNKIEMEKAPSPLSQPINVTKRKSNDFMEMTECVNHDSQPINNNFNIDLTQHCDDQNCTTESKSLSLEEQHSDIATTSKHSKTRNLIIDKSAYDTSSESNNVEIETEKVLENMDLTQSSNSSDELPFVSLTKAKNNSGDDTIIVDVHDYDGIVFKSPNMNIDIENELNLSQNKVNNMKTPVKSQSFFEDFVHNHSDERNSGNLRESDEIDLTQSDYRFKPCEPGEVDLTDSPDMKAIESKDLDNNESDIDLTQHSESSESKEKPKNDENSKSMDVSRIPNEVNFDEKQFDSSQRYSNLGKIGGVSIDYDDLCTSRNEYGPSTSYSPMVYSFDDNDCAHDLNSSQTSVFEISDNELDYSIQKSKLEIVKDNFNIGGISVIDELSNAGTSKKSIELENTKDDEYLPVVNILKKRNNNINREISPIKHKRITEIATPKKAGTNDLVQVTTPQNTELIIRTSNVTPMLDYESMTLPEIHNELDKYGIKPFKRKRAIQLLTHIYNQTHPILEAYADTEQCSPSKRRKPNSIPPTPTKSPKKLTSRKLLISPEKNTKRKSKENAENTAKSPKRNACISNEPMTNKHTSYPVTTEVPVVRDIACKPEDWVFQKREKAKLHSCRVPLHIAFHNYVSSRRTLREAILCYEPVNIDVIHKDLASYGHKYDPKDLLRFLDKRCITVKTTDNEQRNNRKIS